MANYNRLGAVHYAFTFGKYACHDGCIAVDANPPKWTGFFIKVPSLTRFEKGPGGEVAKDPDGNVLVEQKHLEDCTHFIACCIGTPGGGIPVPSPWEKTGGPYGQVAAPKLIKWLVETHKVKMVGSQDLPKGSTEARDASKELQFGDILAYSDSRAKPGVFDHVKHVAILTTSQVGDPSGLITCHTTCRVNEPYENVLHSNVTFLRVTW